jgi:hypothetical protein
MLEFEPERIANVRHREHREEHVAKTIFRCTVIVRDDKVNLQKCRHLGYRLTCSFLSRRKYRTLHPLSIPSQSCL